MKIISGLAYSNQTHLALYFDQPKRIKQVNQFISQLHYKLKHYSLANYKAKNAPP